MRSLSLVLVLLVVVVGAVCAPLASSAAPAPAPSVDATVLERLGLAPLSEADTLDASPYTSESPYVLGADAPESAVPVEEAVVSPRTQAILALDHEFVAQVAANESTSDLLKVTGLGMSTAYNAATANKLFWHSVSAYCNSGSSLQSWSCSSCRQFGAFQVTAVMNDGVNQGYVGYFTQGLPSSPIPGSPVAAHEPFVVVSFRGTVPTKLSNWIEDLSFSKSEALGSNYPGVGVHSGFWHAYQRMKPGMLNGLAAAFQKSGARAMIFTGHSLGAAMAELAAVDMKINQYSSKFAATYTQGSPRPGNAKFGELFAKVISAAFREVHQADCVPHLPPMLMGFQHGPTEVWLNKDFSKTTVCSGTSGEDKKCSNSLLMPVSIPDHLTYRKGVSVGTYCNSVRATAPEEAELETMEQQTMVAVAAPAAPAVPAKKRRIILREI